MHRFGLFHQRSNQVHVQVLRLDGAPQLSIERDFRRHLKVADERNAVSSDKPHQRRPAFIELPVRRLRFL